MKSYHSSAFFTVTGEAVIDEIYYLESLPIKQNKEGFSQWEDRYEIKKCASNNHGYYQVSRQKVNFLNIIDYQYFYFDDIFFRLCLFSFCRRLSRFVLHKKSRKQPGIYIRSAFNRSPLPVLFKEQKLFVLCNRAITIIV